jgi:hypothetical protein
LAAAGLPVLVIASIYTQMQPQTLIRGRRLKGKESRARRPSQNSICCFDRISFWVAALSVATALGMPSVASAQDSPDAHPFTVSIAGGGSLVSGNYAQGLNNRYSLEAGAGIPLVRQQEIIGRYWSLYLTADFMFNQSGISGQAVSNTQTLNPQNPTLLSATSGREQFFSTALGPTLRFPQLHSSGNWPVGLYAFGGYGVLRRTVDLTGVPIEGAVLQPSNPVVASISTTSGAFDAGIGTNVGRVGAVGGLMFFVELRAVHGLGVNSGTTVAPAVGVRW